jgi:hypothetical protein
VKRLRVLMSALAAVSIIFIAAPVANANECEDGDPSPSCQPCGEKINAITQKLYGDDLITCPW